MDKKRIKELRAKIQQQKSCGYPVIVVTTDNSSELICKWCEALCKNSTSTTKYTYVDETTSRNDFAKIVATMDDVVDTANSLTELVSEGRTNQELLKRRNIIVTRHTVYDNVDTVHEYHYKWSKVLSPEEKAYVDSLAIPPAWTPAHVFRKNQKVLWVAKDKKKRWQWRYSKDWSVQQEFRKISDLEHMTPFFWRKFNKTLTEDMQQETWTTRRLAAIASKVMHKSHLRPGWKEPSRESPDDDENHFGLITMQNKHLDLTKNEIRFVGKSGKCNVSKLKGGHDLIRLLKELKSHGKDDDLLFEIKNIKLTTAIFSRYLNKLGIKPKQFRTHYANTALAKYILKSDAHDTTETRKKNLRTAYKRISRNLNNTPKMTENSYVFSGLPALYIEDPDTFLHLAAKGLPTMIKHFKRVDWRDISANDDDRNGLSKPKPEQRKLEHIVVFMHKSFHTKHAHRFPTKLVKHISI